MHKFLQVAVLGAAAAGFGLAAPAESQARDFGIHIGLGDSHFGYHRGHSHYYDSYSPRYYDSYSPRYYGSYGSYGSRVIYHPEYSHWTPDIGLHSHGHYHVVPRHEFHHGSYGNHNHGHHHHHHR